MIRNNVSAAAFGTTKCGKNTLLWDWVSKRFPRVISFDPVGDTWDRNPDAVAVRGVDDLRRHLRRCVTEYYTDWHFVMSPVHAPDVFALLVPLDAEPSPDAPPSLSRQLGGVLIECGEVYEIAPNAGTKPSILRAWTAGRHHLLSLAVAAQRPALTNRTLTGNTEHTFAFMHGDARDFEFFANTISGDVADEIRTLDKYEFVHYVRGDRAARRYDKRRKLVREIPLLKSSPVPFRPATYRELVAESD